MAEETGEQETPQERIRRELGEEIRNAKPSDFSDALKEWKSRNWKRRSENPIKK